MERAQTKKLTVVATTFTVFLLCTARPQYRSRLPNADAGSGSGLPCKMLGHSMCTPGRSTVNAFGSHFAASGYRWTKEFCMRDSDGDGVSNGAELGDPCCEFPDTQNIRTTDLSNPADRSSFPRDIKHRSCQKKNDNMYGYSF